MILDTSAIVGILMREPAHEIILAKLSSASHPGVGIPTLAETAIVLSARLGKDSRGLLFRFLQEAAITPVPFVEVHYSVAVGAWLRYGRGRHRAALNFGDCLSYATAKVAGQPLLCTGSDFARTDLEIA